MVRPAGAGDSAQRLCDRRALLRRQEGAPRERVGHDRFGESVEKPRQNQFLLCVEDLRGQRSALLRLAGARREAARSAARIRPQHPRIRRIPPKRPRSLPQRAIGALGV